MCAGVGRVAGKRRLLVGCYVCVGRKGWLERVCKILRFLVRKQHITLCVTRILGLGGHGALEPLWQRGYGLQKLCVRGVCQGPSLYQTRTHTHERSRSIVLFLSLFALLLSLSLSLTYLLTHSLTSPHQHTHTHTHKHTHHSHTLSLSLSPRSLSLSLPTSLPLALSHKIFSYTYTPCFLFQIHKTCCECYKFLRTIRMLQKKSSASRCDVSFPPPLF